MARNKEFDRDEVLNRAIAVFADHGFAGTSMDKLLQGMGISRQSLYDTFGDKRQLYLEALGRYNQDSVTQIIEKMESNPSPRQGIADALEMFVTRPAAQGCMGVGAICEFGVSDAAILQASEQAGRRLHQALLRVLMAGQASGDINPQLDVMAGANYLSAMLSGLKVAARAGTDLLALRNMVQIALRCLQ